MHANHYIIEPLLTKTNDKIPLIITRALGTALYQISPQVSLVSTTQFC